jgi:hippurate hydrolase
MADMSEGPGWTEDLASRLREVYEDLHAHPELSFAERRTAGIVAGWLADNG